MSDIDTEYRVLEKTLTKLEMAITLNNDQVTTLFHLSEIKALSTYIHTLEWSLGLRTEG